MNKLLICMAVACVTAVNAAAQSFSAATYNIRQLNARFDTAEGNGWERRLPVISSLVRFHDFDIFGAQEVFHSQLGHARGAARLRLRRRRTRRRGRGRILRDLLQAQPLPTARFGYFWLRRPLEAGKGWDAKYVRICTWGRFYDEQGRQRILVHHPPTTVSRLRPSCRLILAKIEVVPRRAGHPRATSTSRARRAGAMRSARLGILSDTYDTAEIRYAETGTKTGSTRHQTFRRIDYLFVTPGFHGARYGILTDTYRSETRTAGQIPGPDSVGPLPVRTGIHEAVTFRLT